MCCWACVPCKKHEYMVSYKECADCGAGKWPHENRTSCYELPAKVSDTHSFLITLIYYHHHYGNTGCGVFKGGIQNWKGFWLKKQHTQRKLLNFANWCNGGDVKKC